MNLLHTICLLAQHLHHHHHGLCLQFRPHGWLDWTADPRKFGRGL